MDWSSFVFAHTLKARLRDGLVETLGRARFRVRGKLDAPAVVARIEIEVPQDFRAVVEAPPRAWCREPWMRTGSDWHNDSEAGMCWVLENEWRDVLGGATKQPRDIVRIGSNWLMNNVTSLISRHHYADLMGLKKWLNEWDAWPHYHAGVEQYEREQRARRHQQERGVA